jgi:hypothetical protein
MSNRQWNTVAAIAGTLTVVYATGCLAAMLYGKIAFTEFSAAVMPVVTGWGGYMAALLPKRDG